jgi:two-component system chemotaxis sensor kinase CheA
MQVVVYTHQGRSVGLVVDRILDITNEKVTARTQAGRMGTLGSVVVQGRVTELLDVKSIVQAAEPSFFQEPVAA